MDLAPLLEQSGIKEDYFPMAFSTWRTGDSIYGIRYSGDCVERFFDDGAHPTILSTNILLLINANAANKERAWEFLRFMLSEEIQGSMVREPDSLPVKKSAYWAAVLTSMRRDITSGLTPMIYFNEVLESKR